MSHSTGPVRYWAVPLSLVLLGAAFVGLAELGLSTTFVVLRTAVFATVYVTMPFVIFAGLFGVYFRYLAWRE